MLKRFFFTILFFSIFSCPLLEARVLEEKPHRPNVILVIMDATRAGHLSCYGYSKSTSEKIDRIAAEGVLYEQCISPASWTLPSLASFFTGMYTKTHRVSSKSLILRDRYLTLAELFRSAGYRTQGYSSNPWVGEFSGLDQGFEDVEDIWRRINANSADAGAAETNRLTLQWIDTLPDREPFFLYLHYMEPHFPYRPPQPFDRLFTASQISESELEKVRSWESPRELGYILKDPDSLITPEEMELLRAQYDGEIAYLDRKIGELIDGLSSRGLMDESVLIITADHGEHIGDHGLLDHKMSVYDGLTRVPLIIRYPARLEAGKRVRKQVQTIDLFPTLVRLCSLEETETEGMLLPFDESSAQNERVTYSQFARPLLFIDVIERHFPMADYSKIDRELISVRTDPFKLIWASDGRNELYDIRKDPGELKNLISTHSEVAEQLLKKASLFADRTLK